MSREITEKQKAWDTNFIPDMIWGFHVSLWHRQKKMANEIIELMMDWPLSAYTSKQMDWIDKANRLLNWLNLSENRQLWRHERKTLPYSRNTKEYHNWRIDCLNRDNWTCQDCGNKKDLHVHHIKLYKDYVKERLNVDNGITLCKDCHKIKHKR